MKRLTVRIPDDIHKFVREKSFSTGKSMNNIIIGLLEKGMIKDRADFEKAEKEKNEKIKEAMKIYKSGDKEKAGIMYKEITGENLPEWLWDVLED
jgi:hypothetical protein